MQKDRIGYENRAEDRNDDRNRNGNGARNRHGSGSRSLPKRFEDIGRNADGSPKWYEAYGVSNSWDSHADMRKPSIGYILDPKFLMWVFTPLCSVRARRPLAE